MTNTATTLTAMIKHRQLRNHCYLITCYFFIFTDGFLDAQVTLRTCVSGVTFDEQENRCFDRHSSYNFMYQLIGKDFQDREMTNADGNLCGCNHAENCNSQEGAMIDMKSGGHTPKPNGNCNVPYLFACHRLCSITS